MTAIDYCLVSILLPGKAAQAESLRLAIGCANKLTLFYQSHCGNVNMHYRFNENEVSPPC